MKSLAIVLYSYCGVSMSRIGTLFGVSTVSVLRWVKAAGEAVSDPVPHAENGIVMLDEMLRPGVARRAKTDGIS
jgi:transposase-like protein